MSCYECDTGPNGEELYTLYQEVSRINCLATGWKGDDYKWAIVCGPNEMGGSTELNMGPGEYSCGAFRQGPKITNEGLVYHSAGVPCQWMQLTECGCAPGDVFSFGVEPPNLDLGWQPCLTEEDCRFLCADAGEEKAKNLCYSFGGIEWWEGVDNKAAPPGLPMGAFSPDYAGNQKPNITIHED